MKWHLPSKKLVDFLETGIVSSSDVVPTVFGQEVCSSKKSAICYNKNVYAIHFILAGKGFLEQTPLGEGDVFLARPHCKKAYRPNPSDPWSYIWLEFQGSNVEKYLSHCGFAAENDILKLSDLNGVIQIFARVFKEVPKHLNHHAKNMLYIGAALELFAEICEECGYLAKNKEKSFQLINYESIVHYINGNFSNPDLTVASTAKAFSYAPSYLTRLFRKYSNMPPCKYITKVRMEKAVELMNNRSYSISQIANIVGYQSQFYFSKAFLQYYGIRPSVYLKEKAN